MAQRNEITAVYAAAAVQGVVLVTFPAASAVFTSASAYGLSSTEYGAMFVPQAVTAIGSALLPLTISFGAKQLTTMAASVAGGLIAFYQIGYGIAAFGVGPLQSRAGLDLNVIYGGTALVALVMSALSVAVVQSANGIQLTVTKEKFL